MGEVADAFRKLREGVKQKYEVDFTEKRVKPQYGSRVSSRVVGSIDEAVRRAA